VTVELHGWLSEEVIGELEVACGSEGGALILDLSHLVGADAAGRADLRRRVAAGAKLRGASPYIRLLLKSGD